MKKEEVITEIERYFVYPGQACSYMVGCQTILSLRHKAQAALADRFDLKEFHDGKIMKIFTIEDKKHDFIGLCSRSPQRSIAVEHSRKYY